MAGKKDDACANASTSDESRNDNRPECKYGKACYQKNRAHLDKYRHPPKAVTGEQKDEVCNESKKRRLTPSPAKDEKANRNKLEVSPKQSKKNFKPSPVKKFKDNLVPDSFSSDSEEDLHQCSVKPTAGSDSKKVLEIIDEPDMPPSPSNVKENIKQKFLFEMPEDFYSLWEFCKSLSKEHPASAFKDVGLKLVGPYDVLSGNLRVPVSKRKQSLFLLHWRYYYDPPEFQTVLKGDDKKQFHIGYFRDEPGSLPVFLASNCAAKDGKFSQVAENIFGAVNAYLMDLKKSGNPFLQPKIPKLQRPLQEWAKEHGYTLDTKTQAMKQRDRKVVTKTFHGLGLVVPVEKRTEVGYRELMETDANLRRILSKIVNSNPGAEKDQALDKLTQIITAANIANDECDFGTSVELGLDLFSFGGSDLEQSALQLLSTGYNLLGRKEFAQIAKVHLSNRRKDAFPTPFN